MDGSLSKITLDTEYPALMCPACGWSLYEFRQRLKCGNKYCHYEDACCSGAPCDEKEVSQDSRA